MFCTSCMYWICLDMHLFGGTRDGYYQDQHGHCSLDGVCIRIDFVAGAGGIMDAQVLLEIQLLCSFA